MKAIEIVKPFLKEISIEGVTFFLELGERYAAIDEDGRVFGFYNMPRYDSNEGMWRTQDFGEYRYLGQVEFELGDSFDKVYQL